MLISVTQLGCAQAHCLEMVTAHGDLRAHVVYTELDFRRSTLSATDVRGGWPCSGLRLSVAPIRGA